MSATALLAADLNSLITDSKRKSNELRQASESSLRLLKDIVNQTHTDKDALKGLSKSPVFINPFLIACSTRNVKYTATALQSLQRLVIGHAIPSFELNRVLDALDDAAHLGTELQLRVLQCLPAFTQSYNDDLVGDLLNNLLFLCSKLQASKVVVVINTASATLEQIIVSVFERLSRAAQKSESTIVIQLDVEGQKLSLNQCQYDAQRIFSDLCLLTEGSHPNFLKTQSIPKTFGLELIESILTNHYKLFRSHLELASIIRLQLCPLVINLLRESLDFAICARALRVIYILIQRLIPVLQKQCENVFDLLIALLDPNQAPNWKRVICMEVIQGVCSDYSLVLSILRDYDMKQGEMSITDDLVTALLRVSSEQSSTASRLGSIAEDSVANDQQQNPGMGLEEPTPPQDIGSVQSQIIISLDSSVVKVPNIEKLDKTDAPSVPPSYIYYLVLISFCSLSDGLAQFVIPLCSENISSVNRKRGGSDATKINSPHSSPTKKRQGQKLNINNDNNGGSSGDRSPSPSPLSKTRGKQLASVPMSQGKAKLPLVDPKSVTDNPFYKELVLSTSFLEKTWKQFLAAFTIFLRCDLDNDIFHMLLRSLQILTQVAGVLRVNSARDAFLGMLAKMAMPSMISPPSDELVATTPDGGMLKRLMSMDSIVGSLSGSPVRHTSSSSEENIAPRSLLCLRALLNLGIALGPILGLSWTTILESLCYSEPLVATALHHANKGKDVKNYGYNIPNEAQAVKSSIKRLLDSTGSYPDESFVEFMKCLLAFGQMNSTEFNENTETSMSETSSYVQASEPQINVGFTLDKLSRVCEANTLRFLSGEPSLTGWSLASSYLVEIATSTTIEINLRSESSEILHKLILNLANLYSARSDNSSGLSALNEKDDLIYLKALSLEFETIAQSEKQGSGSSQMRNVDCDIHVSALRTLYSLLDQYGIKRPEGWIEVFQMIVSCFDLHGDLANLGSKERMFPRAVVSSDKGPVLVKEAFGCLSLINNDLIPNLPNSTLPYYINALHCFCLQQVDVNVSFTASSFTWTVSDYLEELQSSSGKDLDKVVHSFSELKELLDPTCHSYIPSLWLLVVCRIAEVCCDPRVEVRNGAIQVLYRIFCSHSASATHKNTWTSCFFLVMKTFMTIEPIVGVKFGAQQNFPSQDDIRTIPLVMKTILQMFKEAFEEENFDIASDDSWDLLIHFCAKEAALQVPEITASVFSFLSELMALVITKKVPLSSQELESIWNLWCKEGKDIPLTDDTSAIGALIEIIKCLPSIYVAFGRKFSLEQLEEALNILKRYLEWPYLSPYTSDVEKLSPLQQAVLESVKLIESDSHQETSLLLHFVCDIAALAFRQEGIPIASTSNGLRGPRDHEPSTPKRQSPRVYRPTFVALAFECFDTMGDIFSRSHLKTELLLDGSAAYLLSSLSLPISKRLPTGMVTEKPLQVADSLWRSATDKFIKAVQEILVILSKVENSPNVKIGIWTEVIQGVCLILEGNPNRQEEEVSGKDSDEEFDIKALMSLMEHIRPGISDPDIPDTLISNLLSSLLGSSQLYDSDAIINDNTNMIEALQDLSNKARFGRTDAITVTSRRRLSIKCLQELFDIALTEDKRQTRLSHAALEFVLWRSGLAIRDFTFDQPLRGLLPIPRIQRRELVLVLKGLNNLITVGKLATKNKHLYNLLLGSMMPASRDAEILYLLEEIFKKM